MTEKAAQLYSMHTRKANRLWKVAKNYNVNVENSRTFQQVINLALRHDNAASAVYNYPGSWERSETDRKLAEIKAYLGSPLYDEWLEAGVAENFEQYVADEYDKTFKAIMDRECGVIDPRSLRERLHDEAGADLGRMNTDLRNGG